VPPPGTEWGALSAGHSSSQTDPVAQLTEQEPVQVTSQVVPVSHETLPLAPTVTRQVDMPSQVTLHEAPQVPVQTL